MLLNPIEFVKVVNNNNNFTILLFIMLIYITGAFVDKYTNKKKSHERSIKWFENSLMRNYNMDIKLEPEAFDYSKVTNKQLYGITHDLVIRFFHIIHREYYSFILSTIYILSFALFYIIFIVRSVHI